MGPSFGVAAGISLNMPLISAATSEWEQRENTELLRINSGARVAADWRQLSWTQSGAFDTFGDPPR